jgi:hypothetical protein
MKFDSSRAWTQASQAVSANREVVLALAGVFFLLPLLAFAIFFPSPETGSGMSEQQMMQVVRTYYASAAPAMLPLALLQALGTLSLLCLLDARQRPTVGGAIKAGLKGLLPYLVAQVLMMLAMGAIALVVVGGFGAAGGVVGMLVGLAIVGVVLSVLSVRLSVVAPAIATEHVFNPAAALARSWALTRGNTARLLGFYTLLVVAMVVVMIFASVLTIPISLVLPVEAARLVSAVVQSILTTGTVIYSVAVLAQVHEQLVDGTPEAVAGTFE